MGSVVNRVSHSADRSRIGKSLGVLIILWTATVSGASLKPETVNAWDDYVRTAHARIKQRVSGASSFLWIDESPDRAAQVLRKHILVAPVGPQVPAKVPDGLVHDWIGGAFIPNAEISDVLRVVRDYARYREIYNPNVIESQPLAASKMVDRFSMVLTNRSLFSKTALQGEYQSSYVRVDDRRLYSISFTTSMREVADYGSPGQHLLPENEGMGLIWRAYSITRFEERNGGVFIETEFIALSRDIPAGLRWLVEPIVRHTSRDALTTALRQTKEAVECSLAARETVGTRHPALTNLEFNVNSRPHHPN